MLDVGCGTGKTLIEMCAKFGCSGVGVDLSDEQIKDARIYLRALNEERKDKKLPRVRVQFVRASGSELKVVFKDGEMFSHVISQDAIMLVADKQALYESIYGLLKPGGVFALADFLAETKQNELSDEAHDLVYKLVNWTEGFSFKMYQKVLAATGLKVIKAEQLDGDMILTYAKLAKKMKAHESKSDVTYSELKKRYEGIVAAVETGKMGWAMLVCQKPARKTALIAGTKTKSIGRFVAMALHKLGYEIWLYSRSAEKIDKAGWHERACDITSEKSIDKLLSEVKRVDITMMLADTEGGHGGLTELTEDGIKACVGAKLIGSALLSKMLIKRFSEQPEPMKFVWCAGKTGQKPMSLMLYGLINAGIASFVEELNRHYSQSVAAYYLPTGLISPSTIGDEFIKHNGLEMKKVAQPPTVIVSQVMSILEDKIAPGMMPMGAKVL